MLRTILSPETCAECRLCCMFDRTDIWELPVLSEENVCAVKRVCSDAAFTEEGGEHTFAAPELKGGKLFRCPVLSDKGCTLSREEMPFDCRIWPFRLMRDEDGNVVIAVSELCRGVACRSDKELLDFLGEGLGRTILSFGEKHPDHIKPLMPDYRILVK